MYKATNDSSHMRERAGSFSTRASARGVNLLGWGSLPEKMTPEQELQTLKEIKQLIQNRLTHEAMTPDQRKELGREIQDIEFRRAHLQEGQPRQRSSFLDRAIVDAAKELLPPNVWRSVVERAHERLEAANIGWDRRPVKR